MVSFTLSNTGPRSLDYYVYWLECRSRGDFTRLTTNEGRLGFVPLPSGAVTNLAERLARSPSAGDVPLFCCQIEWLESEPRLWRLGRKLEPWLSQTMGIFDSQWVPPWESASKPRRAGGTIFSANVQVAEYFRRVYDFTRREWLEERARYETLMAQQATQGHAFAATYEARAPSHEQSIRLRARSAFVRYCQITTNVSEQAKPATALDRPLTNR